MCLASSIYIPLLPERYTLGIQGYKHFAPPEQPQQQRKMTFRAKLGSDPVKNCAFAWF
jgi:hypothetical protein